MRIAFLFLTIDNLYHNNIWKLFFNNATNYKIYAHSKYDSNLPQIKHKIPTKWGDISLVKATLLLMEESIKDNNDMYILLSDSTVPFRSYDYILKYLSDKQNYTSNIEFIKPNLYKMSQWWIFNKDTVKKILSLTSKYINDNRFNRTQLGAPDELYFATIMRENNIKSIEQNPTYLLFNDKYNEMKPKLIKLYNKFKKEKKNLSNLQIKKFENEYEKLWTIAKDSGKHPISYNKIMSIKMFDKPDLLFGRKFEKTSDIKKYLVKKNKFVGFKSVNNKEKYLVIIPSGKDTYHLYNKYSRMFTLAIIYYDEGDYEGSDADYIIKAKGPKWKLIQKALKQIPYEKYKYIWFPDDDLRISQYDVNELFKIVDKNNLELSQPSLLIPNESFEEIQNILKLTNKYNPILTDMYELRTKYPKYERIINKIIYRISHYHQLKQSNNIRETHFVEVQQPIMSVKILNELKKYIMSPIVEAGFGLDDIWNRVIKKKYIIDQISTEHMRDIGYLKYKKYEKDKITKQNLPKHFQIINKSPDEEKLEMLRYFKFIRSNLVIIPTGNSTYHDFTNYKERTFDICIIYYGEGKENYFKNQSDYFFKMKAPKWKLIKCILQKIDWKLYDYIWIPDDDLVINPCEIDKLFKVAKDNNLELSQPAVAIPNMPWENVQQILKLIKNKNNIITISDLFNLREKYPKKEKDINKILYRISYPDLIRKGNKIRKSEIIEIQMPLFSKTMLEKLYKYITDPIVETGFGLDILWNNKIKDKYVIDFIEVKHMRDTGFMKYEKYKKGKLNKKNVPEQYRNLINSPLSESNKLLKKYL